MSDAPEYELGEVVVLYHKEWELMMLGTIRSFCGETTIVSDRGERYLHVFINEGWRIERQQ